tara:strand:- start:1071 stop:1673 length:603 start_codon:yes stop_codon:yes gene_type:complete
MTNTVTLDTDHLGSDRPYVVGHKYEVIGTLNITSYRTGSPATAASLTMNAANANPDTIARNSGTAFDFLASGFLAGDYVTILGSDAANNAQWMKVGSVVAETMTMDATVALTANTGGGDEQVLHVGEKVLASSFGLSELHSMEFMEKEFENGDYSYVISTDKSYAYVYVTDKGGAFSVAGGKALAADLGTVKVRAQGLPN